MGAASLEANLTTTGTATVGSSVNFSLKLSNKGSSAISNIKITDPAGAAIKDNITLTAGNSTDITFDKTFDAAKDFYVIIKGKDGSGKEVSTESNKIAVGAAVDSTEDEDQIIDPENGISLVIRSDKSELDKPQKITLTMEIHNLLKDQGYSDIVIIDKATKKEVQKIDKLEPGQEKTLESEVEVKEDTVFLYTVKAKADDGTQLELDSNTLNVKVGKGVRNTSFILFLVIFLIVLLLLIGTGIALFVISKKQKKKKQASNPYSDKYKNKISSDDMPEIGLDEAKKAPLSTFSIDDSHQDTMPINIPQQSSDFSVSDYDDVTHNLDETNIPLDQMMGGPGSDETRPLKKPFQTIDYDDLDPDKH